MVSLANFGENVLERLHSKNISAGITTEKKNFTSKFWFKKYNFSSFVWSIFLRACHSSFQWYKAGTTPVHEKS